MISKTFAYCDCSPMKFGHNFRSFVYPACEIPTCSTSSDLMRGWSLTRCGYTILTKIFSSFICRRCTPQCLWHHYISCAFRCEKVGSDMRAALRNVSLAGPTACVRRHSFFWPWAINDLINFLQTLIKLTVDADPLNITFQGKKHPVTWAFSNSRPYFSTTNHQNYRFLVQLSSVLFAVIFAEGRSEIKRLGE